MHPSIFTPEPKRMANASSIAATSFAAFSAAKAPRAGVWVAGAGACLQHDDRQRGRPSHCQNFAPHSSRVAGT